MSHNSAPQKDIKINSVKVFYNPFTDPEVINMEEIEKKKKEEAASGAWCLPTFPRLKCRLDGCRTVGMSGLLFGS